MKELTFALEPYTQKLRSEAVPLVQAHAAEVKTMPEGMEVRVPEGLYLELDAAGFLKVYTARDSETSELVGYNVFTIMNREEINALMAQHNSMFLRQDYRKGFNAMKFLKWCDDHLASIGVCYVTQHVTEAVDYSPLLRRLGYSKTETIYGKRLWEHSQTR